MKSVYQPEFTAIGNNQEYVFHVSEDDDISSIKEEIVEELNTENYTISIGKFDDISIEQVMELMSVIFSKDIEREEFEATVDNFAIIQDVVIALESVFAISIDEYVQNFLEDNGVSDNSMLLSVLDYQELGEKLVRESGGYLSDNMVYHWR